MEAQSSGAAVRNLSRQRPACAGVQNDHFHGGSIGGVTDMGVLVLRHLARNRLVTQANNEDVVIVVIRGSHSQAYKLKWPLRGRVSL